MDISPIFDNHSSIYDFTNHFAPRCFRQIAIIANIIPAKAATTTIIIAIAIFI